MNRIDMLKNGDIRATVVKPPSGNDIIIVEPIGACGDDWEMVLDESEALALHEWLGRALQIGERP